MSEIDKYIGKPFKFLGDTIDAFDCLGMLKLWSAEHQWNISWSDNKEITKDWYEKNPLRFLLFLRRNFKPIKNIDELKYGDIVYTSVNSEGHTGIYVGYGKLLSHQIPTDEKSICMIYRRQFWSSFFICGFRYIERKE